MSNLRKNVWELGKDWADPILWYARGVAAMKARAIKEPTSWAFYAAIHGIETGLWQKLGYLDAAAPMPSKKLRDTFWDQCQHGSWYFLPWHRGYLLAFESVIRAAVVKLGGPADWALPYWNYFRAKQAALPPAFASPDWPDGTGDNPLFVPERYGPNNDGKVNVPRDQVDLKAMGDPDFTGVASGGSPGFGGVDTGFAHLDGVHGGIERQPHDAVHVLVGGGDERTQLSGLMSDPDTAALDPIFWLHHANIDRLWQVWRENPPSDTDPVEPRWLKGPAFTGERAFAMPMPDGSTWNYTPADMTDLKKLGYGYDDVSPAVKATALADRLMALGGAAAGRGGGGAMRAGKNVELVGASTGAVPLEGRDVRATVKLDKQGRQKVSASLKMAAAAGAAPVAPDRVFLNLEDVRGLSDATAFKVYVGVPDGADPAKHPELLAGSVALFGVRKASRAGGPHGGRGLTFVLEITDIVDRLHLQNALDVDALGVRIVPIRPVPKQAQVTIGRISIYRQGH